MGITNRYQILIAAKLAKEVEGFRGAQSIQGSALTLFEVRVVNLTTKANIANKKFFTFIIWQLVTAKICFKSSYFWFLWQAKDQNIQLKTNYGH